MGSDKIHKINIDSFVVSKLTDEGLAIDIQLANADAKKGEIEDALAKYRNKIEVSEKELDEVCSSIVILKGNRSVIKEKVDILKKQRK